MADLTLSAVSKDYGATRVLSDIDLEVRNGEFVVIVGPSGCGKSTLLRIIAGLEEIQHGQVRIGGEDVSRKAPAERGIAMVFQTYALYPHKTVFDNMGYGLKLAGRPRAEIRAEVLKVARILELEPYLERKPAALSGGQRQRVAIGRAIVRNPRVFLFDEPLSNLDAALRGQMRIEIADLHVRLNATMVYVTHDQVEAMTMADRIVVLDAGRVVQQGAPLELYHHPLNLFVAGFLGAPAINLLAGRCSTVTAEAVVVDIPGVGAVQLPVDGRDLAAGDPVTFGIRPHDLQQAPARYGMDVNVRIVEPLGGETIVYGNTGPAGTPITASLDGDATITTRRVTRFSFDAADGHLFRSDGRSCRRLAAPGLTPRR